MLSSRLVAILMALTPVIMARPYPQIGGEAQACYSILNNVDNGSGYGIEDAEDNLAQAISGKAPANSNAGNTGGNAPAPAPPAANRRRRRQLNKVAPGFQNLADALNVGQAAEPVTTLMDNVDTAGTDDAAQLGEQIGEDEVDFAESIGSSVPTQL